MRASIIGATALALAFGSLVLPASAVAEPRMAPVVAESRPMAAAAISGTPAEILREVPVTEPLVSGFQSGLFQPKGALYVKDAQGCTKRNRILISIATKKPKVGKNCVLSGGE